MGKKASHFAWLLVQHADSDVKFQEYCLKLMRKELESSGVDKSNIAYLTDRILVNKGMKQIYGTQFYEDRGKMVPRPIENPNKLNAKRRKMGLEPFEVYKKRVRMNDS